MSGGGGLLGVGLSGLLASQRALSVTSHNISNANTEGYSRQRVGLEARPPQLLGSSYQGNGVEVGAVNRIYDQFLVDQAQSNTSASASSNTYSTYLGRIDNLLANPEAGVGSAVQSFFTAMNQVASDPSSQPARQLLLGSANSLVDRFKYVNDRFSELRQQTNTALRDSVTQINTLARGIAELNTSIASATGAAGGGQPNDLLDKRDVAVNELAKLVSVSAIPQDNGSLNVFIGSGQALVVGSRTQPLSITDSNFDSSRKEIGYAVGSSIVDITNQLSGGSVGGLINFRNQVLDQAQNSLGRVAAGLAETMNTQHQLGVDLTGAFGGKLFNTGAPVVSANSVNTGSGAVSAALISANSLTASDYRLTYDGGNNYTLTRNNDGQTFAINTGGSSPYTSSAIDGLSLTMTSGAAVGDTFLVRPTYATVANMTVAITEGSKIAAAAPIRTAASLGNAGNGAISAGAVNSPNDRLAVRFTAPGTYDVLNETTGATLVQGAAYSSGGNITYNGVTVQVTNGGSGPATGDTFYVDQKITSADSANTGGARISQATINAPDPDLRDNVSIVFTSPTTFNIVGATSGSPTTNVPYTPGSAISYNGWNLAISGTPATGDTFTVGANTTGVGDNRNALTLSSLQQKLTMIGGTATYQDAYGQMIADVGSKAQQAKIESSARQTLLKQSVEARDSVSGVNLDEEAANLIKMQQAYQASARVITMAETLFQSLLDAVGR